MGEALWPFGPLLLDRPSVSEIMVILVKGVSIGIHQSSHRHDDHGTAHPCS